MTRLARRWVIAGAAVAAGVALLPAAAFYGMLRFALPPLDGHITERGLAGPVTIERDALGVVTITASNRDDLAFGTGFVHGEDRFFQMDLARRLAAGELSALVGSAALPQDIEARPFRFRAVAREALAEATPQQRALLAAYARGVDAGLASLDGRPWEYWLLRASPEPWKPEDTYLVAYAMWWELQHGDLERDRLRRTLDARLGGPMCGRWKCALDFLYPARTAWDAPNVLDSASLRSVDALDAAAPAIPGPDEIDVRGRSPSFNTLGGEAVSGSRRAFRLIKARRDPEATSTLNGGRGGGAHEDGDPVGDIGSNAWGVAGEYSDTGAALVASDMHLPLQVPPTWYRARLRIAGAGVPEGSRLELDGLTLPGAPGLVAGSNGHVAWAFTNSGGDWIDARAVRCLAVGPSSMRTPTGGVPVTTVTERIAVRGRPDYLLPVTTGPEGVLFDVEAAGHRCWFARWLADVPAATNLNLIGFERATSVQEVLALASEVGIPAQNLIVGDSAGHIGWTIAGRMPVRAGEPRPAPAGKPGIASAGGPGPALAGAPAWLSAADVPRIYDPPLGRLWSANARATEDPAALEAIGGGDAAVGAQYDLGARARQIRDALLTLGRPATPADMLRIQLDDRALFLARWRGLILELLDPAAVTGHPGRAQMRRLVGSWDARAEVDSVGYRLVRAYRDRTARAVWQMILGALAVRSDAPPPPQFERPLWALVTRRPLHMLAAGYPSWRAFLLGQLDDTVSALRSRCGALARCRWGAAHPVHIRNPLSRALPFLARLIDLPTLELPGDRDMPRVQHGAFGASERFAVSPGHEAEGYLHIPGGESDDPLSPYYRAGFRAWAEGRPLPLLPGPPEHRLLLQPARRAARSASAVHSVSMDDRDRRPRVELTRPRAAG